jgi:hypothetical protein
MIRAFAAGFGMVVGFIWLADVGSQALAKQQAADLFCRLMRERRERDWKAL